MQNHYTTGNRCVESSARYYLIFSRGRGLRFLSHLDMMRLWERALRRAALPLRYSQGYHPQPRLSLALPLAVGMTAGAEWLEVEMRSPLVPAEVCERLAAHLPVELGLRRVGQARWRAPSLASLVRAAEYEIEIRNPPPAAAVRERARVFLQTDTWPVEERRRKGVRSVDVRKAVIELEVGPWERKRGNLRMMLTQGSSGSARPGTVLGELGVTSTPWVHRKRLLFREAPVFDGNEVWCIDD